MSHTQGQLEATRSPLSFRVTAVRKQLGCYYWQILAKLLLGRRIKPTFCIICSHRRGLLLTCFGTRRRFAGRQIDWVLSGSLNRALVMCHVGPRNCEVGMKLVQQLGRISFLLWFSFHCTSLVSGRTEVGILRTQLRGNRLENSFNKSIELTPGSGSQSTFSLLPLW